MGLAARLRAFLEAGESKEIIGAGGALAEWGGGGAASRQDGNNFKTNMVTLADYEDRFSSNEDGVLALSAAWACCNLLAGTIASLPLEVFRGFNGSRKPAVDHPLWYILHDSPNADQTSLDFWEFQAACIELRGNSFSEVERAAGGRVIALDEPIPPALVSVRRLANGDLEYDVSNGSRRRTIPQDRMLHIRGFGGSPLGGLSTLCFGARVFGSANAVEGAASQTFRQGARAVGAFVAERQLTAPQMKEAEEKVTDKYQQAVSAGRPLILNNGFKWSALSINPDDAQMLQSRAFSVEEICRFFGVPPFMIGHTEKSTSWGTGLEQQTLGFQKFTLRRRLKRIEQALEKQLLTAADRAAGVSISFNLEGLLRADSKARSQFYKDMTGIGAMTINEVRALENLPPVPGGDVPRIQMQNGPITDAPDALGDPQAGDGADAGA